MKMNEQIMNPMRRSVNSQLRQEGAILLPLRLFIGLGWTRAALEKLLEPAWHNGTALLQFLTEQANADAIYFPFYQVWVVELFVPHVQFLSCVIMIGQLLAGIAIGIGLFTNLALLGGLFMNLNFVLIGRVNPSAFYIVIQTALFAGNAGTILGLDTLVPRLIPMNGKTAVKPSRHSTPTSKRWGYLLLTGFSWLITLLVIPYIRDYSPHSVDDPAMLLFILSALGGLSAFILFARQKARGMSQ